MMRAIAQKRTAIPQTIPAKPSTPTLAQRGHGAEVSSTNRIWRALGNQAVQRMVQPKLQMSEPGDECEQEADRVAAHVMRMPEPAAVLTAPKQINRKCAGCEEEEHEKEYKLQAKPTAAARPAGEAPPIVHGVLRSPGQPLDPDARGFFEPRFERDFADVRIHDDAQAARSVREVGALAYTVGRHIVVDPTHYRRGSTEGRRLLAHELTHVLQQSSTPPLVQRQTAGCQELLTEPGATSLVAGRVVHAILATHFRATVQGATTVAIPGASAGPLRSDAICGGDSKVIDPQIIGGASGFGLPDLARRTPAGVLQVAEIKPAVLPCLVDGEEQELRYIDQGNAQDQQQQAWRASLGVSVVTPMPSNAYPPPVLHLVLPGVTAQLKTAWCTPGLLAYSVTASGEPVVVPVPQSRRSEERERLRSEATSRGLVVATGAAAGIAAGVAGRALWKHFWKVVITRFAVRGAVAAGLAAADGPLPIGDLIALGLTLVTIGQIIADWDDIWREADRLA